MSLIGIRSRRHKSGLQKGAALIEVMIALLILAIGLLGFAGMQTRGMQMARKSYSHSQAVFLAEDIVERMRANLAAVTTGTYAMSKTSAIPTATSSCTTSTPCAPPALAKYDLKDWAQVVTNALPSAQFEVRTAKVNNINSVTVTITYALNTDVESTKVTSEQNKATTIDYTYVLNTELPLR